MTTITIDQYSLLSIPFMFNVIYLLAAILDSHCLSLKTPVTVLSLNITTISLICILLLEWRPIPNVSASNLLIARHYVHGSPALCKMVTLILTSHLSPSSRTAHNSITCLSFYIFIPRLRGHHRDTALPFNRVFITRPSHFSYHKSKTPCMLA